MHDRFSGWNYAFWFIAIVFVLLGIVKTHTLNSRNQGLDKSLRADRSNQVTLQKETGRTTLANYEAQVAHQGKDLYRDLPKLDHTINGIMYPAYTKVTNEGSFQKATPRIKDSAKGDLPTTVLNDAKPQIGQGASRPMSPYADAKDVHVQDQYSNYYQGQIVILTDVGYTLPGRTVTDGRKFQVASSRQHDYYLSVYDFNSGTFHVLMNNHSQSQGGD